MRFRVEIDCGHGKDTPGKRSPDAHKGLTDSVYYLREYKWNREFSKLLASKLNAAGIEVNFTVDPDDDSDPKLTTRYNIANKDKDENKDAYCVFVSIHVNAAADGKEWKSARGYSVWTTKQTNNSDILADCILKIAKEVLPQYNQKVRIYKNEYMRQDFESDFTVIYGANMPAVLVEHMFMDNKLDVEFLKSEHGQEVLSDILVAGIIDYFKLKFPDHI